MNERDQDGTTPFKHCSCFGFTATAVALIERGAHVNERDEDGWTPLSLACLHSCSATAIVLLDNEAVGQI